ncbi:MAG: TetR/AcrR family transcriptional regulator [Cyanobacteria bacterium P01_C01_bin.72]
MTYIDRNSEGTKSEAKTAAILKGAMQEFLKNGYAATSMDKVAKSAGVSKATVYSHFGDKENLFNVVIKDLARDKFNSLMSLEEPQLQGQDPKKVLTMMATKMLEDAQGDRAFQNFIRIIIGESGRFPELAQAYVRNVAQPAITTLTKYFESHPELELKDPEAAVRVMVGTMAYFIMLQEMMHGKDIIPLEGDRVISTLTDLITQSRPECS